MAEKELGEGWCVMVFFIPDSFITDFVNENRASLSFKDLPEINDFFRLL